MPKQLELSELLETLNKNFSVLFEKIDSLKELLTKKEIVDIPKIVISKELEKVEPMESTYPIPLEYRELVDKTLNKSFGVRVEPMTDALAFIFSIIVPDKYSNMPLAQKEVNKVDTRLKVISMAEGINGVREWAERVYKNFNLETQALIMADRIQNAA